MGEVAIVAAGVPRPLWWHPRHDVVVSNLITEQWTRKYTLKCMPWRPCPRSCLRRAMHALNKMSGLDLTALAGFELEFMLFHNPANFQEERQLFPQSVGRAGSYCSWGQFDEAAPFIDDVLSALESVGIQAQLAHAEAAPGQFEIALSPTGVVEAVDNLIVARECVRSVARKHQMVASFIPSFRNDLSGNGSHVHLSLPGHFGGADGCTDAESSDHGISKVGESFMAGILAHLPSLMFLTMPSPLSYARMKPSAWVGAYHTWGVNNREAPLRLSHDRRHFEVKAMDCLANPYLAVAGLISAGMEGCLDMMQLPEPCDVDPALVEESSRPALLPTSIEQSMVSFQAHARVFDRYFVYNEDMRGDLCAARSAEVKYVAEHGLQRYRELLFTLH